MKMTLMATVICFVSMASSASFAQTNYTLKDLAKNRIGGVLSGASALSKQIQQTMENGNRRERAMLDREICAQVGSMDANAGAVSSALLMNGSDGALNFEIAQLILLTSGITNRFCSYRIDKKLDSEVEAGDYSALLKQLNSIDIVGQIIERRLK